MTIIAEIAKWVSQQPAWINVLKEQAAAARRARWTQTMTLRHITTRPASFTGACETHGSSLLKTSYSMRR